MDLVNKGQSSLSSVLKNYFYPDRTLTDDLGRTSLFYQVNWRQKKKKKGDPIAHESVSCVNLFCNRTFFHSRISTNFVVHNRTGINWSDALRGTKNVSWPIQSISSCLLWWTLSVISLVGSSGHSTLFTNPVMSGHSFGEAPGRGSDLMSGSHASLCVHLLLPVNYLIFFLYYLV